jgi:hypothetical protein
MASKTIDGYIERIINSQDYRQQAQMTIPDIASYLTTRADIVTACTAMNVCVKMCDRGLLDKVSVMVRGRPRMDYKRSRPLNNPLHVSWRSNSNSDLRVKESKVFGR